MTTDPRTVYDAVASELTATSSATSSKMFGMPCLKNNGKAFAGYYEGAMVFKLTPPQHTEALNLSGAQLKEWVVVPIEHASRWSKFARAALQYVDGTPG